MKHLFLYFSIFFSGILVSSAQINIDSLKGVWNNPSRPDTARLMAMDYLIKDVYLYSHPDSTFYFSQLMFDFAKEKAVKRYMAEAKNMQGISLTFQGKYDLANEYYMTGLRLNEQIDYKKGISLSLTDIGNNYKDQGDFANALKYYNLCLAIEKEIGDKEGISTSYNNIGVIYYKYGDYAKAIEYHQRSLVLDEEVGDKKGVAYSYINMGVNYFEQGDYVSAIDYYRQGLSIVEEIGDKRAMSSTLNNIALIYTNQKDHENALKYHNWSIDIKQEMGDKKGITASLNNIGLLYNTIGDYKNAFDYLNQGLEINTEIGDKEGVATSLNNIGSVYHQQGDYIKANEFYMSSLSKMQKIGEIGKTTKILGDIGENYHELGDYNSSIRYSNKALNQAQKIKNIVEIKGAANVLYKSYKEMNKPVEALKMYELYISKKDSIDSEQNQREVIRQEYKYTYDKKATADSVAFAKEGLVKDALIQVRDAKIEKSNILQIALFVCLSLLTGFLLYVYSRYRLIRRQKLIITEQNTDIVKAMNQLKQSQLQYKALFISLPDALLVFDDDEHGIINDCNEVAVKLFGKKFKDELIGHSHFNMYPKNRLNNKKKIQLSESGSEDVVTVETSSFEFLINVADGTELPVLVSMSSIEIDGKNQIFALIRDISDIKSYQEELEMSKVDLEHALATLKSTHDELKYSKDRLSEVNKWLEDKVAERTLELETANKKLMDLNKAKSQFLNIISHEIRTPLNGIIGGLMLLKDSKLSEETESLIEILDLSANRLEDFSTKALDISLINSYDKDILKIEKVKVTDIIADAIKRIELVKYKKDIRFKAEFVTDVNTISVDYNYVSKSFFNILHNAVKFSPDNSMVTIHVDNLDDILVVTVKDEGIGFEKGFTVEDAVAFNNKNHEDDNPGLGLYLANQIIKAHGGYIENGNNHDKGAFIKIFIPISIKLEITE